MSTLKTRSSLVLGIALVLVLAFTAACSGDDDGDDPTATTAPAAATATSEPEDEGNGNGNGDDADVEAGRQVAAQQCAACHSFDGSQAVGPTWQGLYGSEVELEDGSTVTADEEYLEESIRDPNAKVVAGFPANVMPNYDGTLSDEQIAQVIAFIQSLE